TDGRTDRGALGEIGLLGQVGDARATAHRHRSPIGAFQSGNDAEEGGLSRSVHTDEADLLLLLYGERDVVEEGAGAERLAEVLEAQNRHGAGRYNPVSADGQQRDRSRQAPA